MTMRSILCLVGMAVMVQGQIPLPPLPPKAPGPAPPTLSPRPSAQPSVSSQPTISAPPSSSPTNSLVPTATPSLMPTALCYDNITIAMEFLDRSPNFEDKLIILCPNTVHIIGTEIPGTSDYANGEAPITVKPKTTIQCGDDGALENNCIIRGGETQFIQGIAGNPNFFNLPDVVVRGLTFEDPTNSVLIVTGGGDLMFEDCVFRNMKARAPIVTINFSPHPFTLIFKGCIFEYMEQARSIGGLATNGIIDVQHTGNFVLLEDCVFRHNRFSGTGASATGFAISLRAGSTLEMRNTCFYNNTFAGWGPIQAFGGAQVTQVSNFAEHVDEVTCDLVAESESERPDKREDVECLPPSLGVCFTGYESASVTSSSTSLRQGLWAILLLPLFFAAVLGM